MTRAEKAEKIALLTSLVRGNPTPLIKHRNRNAPRPFVAIWGIVDSETGLITVEVNRQPRPMMSREAFADLHTDFESAGANVHSFLVI